MSDLKKQMDRAAKLRQQIRDERTRRETQAVEQSEAAESARLDVEIARLEAQLEQEKAMTAEQKGAAKEAAVVANAERRQAEAAVESTTKTGKE